MTEARPLVISELNPALNITLVKDSDSLAKLKDFLDRTAVYGFDVETNVEPTLFRRKVRTIQLGNKEEQYVIDCLLFAGTTETLNKQGNKVCAAWAKPFIDVIKPALEDRKKLKVGTHLQFDYEALRWNFGVTAANFFDCQLAEMVLLCGKVMFMKKGFWGLAPMVERYCRLIPDKELQTSFDLSTAITQEQLEYCALDTRLPLALMNSQSQLGEKHGLTATMQLEFNAISSFGDMHINGFYVDSDDWMAHVAIRKAEHKLNIKNLDELFIPYVGHKHKEFPMVPVLEAAWQAAPKGPCPCEDCAFDHKHGVKRRHISPRVIAQKPYYAARGEMNAHRKACEKYEGDACINYGSHEQIKKVLHAAGFMVEATNDKILEGLAGEPLIDVIREFRSSNKMLDNYGDTFCQDHIDPDTGRVHSHISQLGAESGRTTSSKPNIQNIPQADPEKHGESSYRYAFKARKGYKLIIRDYDGAELRILAELSGETIWIEAFNRGEDVHSLCATMMLAERWKAGELENCAFKLKRQKCKCPEHKKIRNDCKTLNFGLVYGMSAKALMLKIKSTRQFAQDLIDLHIKTFAKIASFLQRLANQAKATLEARTPAGRRRILTAPNRQTAIAKCIKYFIEDDKDPKTITNKDIEGVMRSEWAQIERFGKNVPIQGCNADIIKVAMHMIQEHLEPKYGAFFVNIVHDELVIECPEETAVACNEFVGNCMEEAGTWYIKSMRMTSSGAIEDCWKKD